MAASCTASDSLSFRSVRSCAKARALSMMARGTTRHDHPIIGAWLLDRRRTPLSLTEQGRDILMRLPAVEDEEMLVKSLSAIGPERAQDLLVLLRELVRGMLDSDQMVDELASTIRSTG